MRNAVTTILIGLLYALGITAAAAPAFLAAAPAHAQVVTAPAPSTARACTHECVTEHFAQIQQGSKVAEGGAKWTANDFHYFLRGHIRCENRGSGTATTRNGGWVSGLQIYSLAYCYTNEVAIHVAYQWKSTATGRVTTVWFYPPAHKAGGIHTTALVSQKRTGSFFCEVQSATRCISAVPGGHPVAGNLVEIESSGMWRWNFVQCCTVGNNTFTYAPITNALKGAAILQFSLSATSNPVLQMNNHAGTANFINAGTGGDNALWVYDNITGWLVNVGRSNFMNNWEVLCGDGVGSAATITTRNACPDPRKIWESS